MDEIKHAAANSVCPRCGRSFRCGMKAGDKACRCADAPHGLPVPAPGTAGCYCPDCLREVIAASAPR